MVKIKGTVFWNFEDYTLSPLTRSTIKSPKNRTGSDLAKEEATVAITLPTQILRKQAANLIKNNAIITTRHCTSPYNVTLRRIRATIVAVEKQ